MNYANLLDQFMGNQNTQDTPQTAPAQGSSLLNGNIPGIAGGVAAGGLIGLLVGNKKARKQIGKMTGGVVGLGASAALGALAHKAYSNWQSGQSVSSSGTQSPAVTSNTPQLDEAAFDPAKLKASDGAPFELAIIKAMIAAANADGHIDSKEQKAIFNALRDAPLASDEKSLVMDTLMDPPSVEEVAALANDPAQASEIYLASCLVIDLDHPREMRYLENLAGELSLPPELVQHLNQQATLGDTSMAA